MATTANIQAIIAKTQRHHEQQAEALITAMRRIVEQFEKGIVKKLDLAGFVSGGIPAEAARKLVANQERLLSVLDRYPDAQLAIRIESEVIVNGQPLPDKD